jgi:methanogenic corrinoid protein MtbC1
MTLSVAYINYIASNSKLMNIMLEKDMADIGHGLVKSVILTCAGWELTNTRQEILPCISSVWYLGMITCLRFH